MQAERIPADRGEAVTFTFEGREVCSFEGETVAAALLASGIEAFGETREGEPRAPLCNMGTCFDCAVTVGNERLVRSCLTDVCEGLAVMKHEAS